MGNPSLDTYSWFLGECSKSFKNVFLVPGNHEYYQSRGKSILSIQHVNLLIESICIKFTNVHFLNNKHYDLNEEYVIIGSPLWSYIPDSCQGRAMYYNGDFYEIYIDGDKLVTPKYLNQLHEVNVKWLSDMIEKFKDKKIIIATHYLPSMKLIDSCYLSNPLNHCFATDLERLMVNNVYYWFAGHTHSSLTVQIGECLCVVNPKGYIDENSEYNDSLVIHLDK